MKRPVDETRAATHPTTVLDRVRPTVVVRRRVFEVPRAPHVVHVTPSAEDDENGPPSSVNVARALASLRVDELRRLEEIVSADDDPVVPPLPSIPTIRMGSTIALVDLAGGMGIPKQELVTALVTRGFFAVTVRTVLPRETARGAAAMYGWQVEDDDALEVAPKADSRKRAAAKKKPALKATAKKAPEPPARKKAAKKKAARRRA